MDIRKPFDFDDDSFDFVNARFLVGVFSPGDWPGFLAECKRILRPVRILFLLGRPFLLGTGGVKEEEYDALYNQAMIEMLGEDFCATIIYLSAWGRK